MITTALGATNRFLSICDPSKKGIKSDPNVMNRYISRVCRWSSVFHVNVIFPQPSFYSEIRDLFERPTFKTIIKIIYPKTQMHTILNEPGFLLYVTILFLFDFLKYMLEANYFYDEQIWEKSQALISWLLIENWQV